MPSTLTEACWDLITQQGLFMPRHCAGLERPKAYCGSSFSHTSKFTWGVQKFIPYQTKMRCSKWSRRHHQPSNATNKRDKATFNLN